MRVFGEGLFLFFYVLIQFPEWDLIPSLTTLHTETDLRP